MAENKNVLISCVLISVIGLLVFFPTSDGANILGVFTSNSPSHVIVHMSVMKALAEKGHNVTVITTLKPKVTHESIKTIIIPVPDSYHRELDKMAKEMVSKQNNIFTLIGLLLSKNPLMELPFDVMKDPQFTRIYNMPDTKFDLLVLGYFMNDFQLGLGAKFKCPIVLSWMSPTVEMTDRLIGNPREDSYVPILTALASDGKVMNFMERFKNYSVGWLMRVFSIIMELKLKGYYTELFGNDPNVPPYDEMKKNVSLLFANSHLSEGLIRPNVPGVIEMGGIQIKDKPDPLPEDIASFLDSAKDTGAILFSMGSNFKAAYLNPETMNAVFRVLSKLKQKVIWKWEDMTTIPGKSENILYKKWVPQDDILAHPNIKLFVTHAGRGGTVEAQYHGVPMVALPIAADQLSNADKMVQSGYGLRIEMFLLNEENFGTAVNDVLNNPNYAENVKKFSQLYRDRPMTAKESVVYWTEYVLRHHGAKHMQSPLVHLNYFQSESWDVIGSIFVLLYLFLKIVKVSLKCICKSVCRKTKSKENKVKKN